MHNNQESTGSAEQEEGLIFETVVINIETLIPTIAFSLSVENPDLSDRYVNDLLRHNLVGNQSSLLPESVMRDIERQERLSTTIRQSVFSLFQTAPSDNLNELRDQVLRQNFYAQQYHTSNSTVIIPWESGDVEFDREHEEDQIKAGKRF